MLEEIFFYNELFSVKSLLDICLCSQMVLLIRLNENCSVEWALLDGTVLMFLIHSICFIYFYVSMKEILIEILRTIQKGMHLFD